MGVGRSVARQPGRRDEQNGVHTDANLGGAGPSSAGHESQVVWHPGNARAGKTKGGPPAFTKQNVRDIARGAIQSMVDTRQQNTAEGIFQDGVYTCSHAHDERTRIGILPQALLKRHERKVNGAVYGYQLVQHAPTLDGN